MNRTFLFWITLCLVAVLPCSAFAAGFYLLPRGSRGAASGGAVVASVSGPDALWYNPAGLTRGQDQLLVDFELPIERVDFQRVNGGGQVEPEVTARGLPLPVPGLGYSEDFGLRDTRFGVGLFVPSAALLQWPSTVTDDAGRTVSAPQRYSILSMNGSALGMLTAGVAYRPLPWLSVGGALWLVGGRFVAEVVMSACDHAFLCQQPESERWDARARVTVDRIIQPTGAFGLAFDLDPVHLGASFTLPFALKGDARFSAELPENDVFRGAKVNGNSAQLNAPFPWILRTGAQWQVSPQWDLELGYTLEAWSRQKAMRLTPKGISISNVAGIEEPYPVGQVDLPRNMRDTHALSLATRVKPSDLRPLWLTLGTFAETGAFDDRDLTVLTPDSDKLGIALGLIYQLSEAISVDGHVGQLIFRERNVDNSRIYQPTPLRPPPDETAACEAEFMPGCPVPIGNGRYRMRATYLGLGLRWTPG